MDFLQNLCKKILSVVAHAALTITGAFTMLLSLGGFLSGELIGGGIVLLLGFAMTAIGTRSFWYPGYKEKQAEKSSCRTSKTPPWKAIRHSLSQILPRTATRKQSATSTL